MQPLAAAPVLWAGQGSTVNFVSLGSSGNCGRAPGVPLGCCALTHASLQPAHLGTTGPPAACGAHVETAAATPLRVPVSVVPASTGPAASTVSPHVSVLLDSQSSDPCPLDP